VQPATHQQSGDVHPRTVHVKESFAKICAVPIPSTPAEYRKFLLGEQAKWGAVVKAIGFKEETAR